MNYKHWAWVLALFICVIGWHELRHIDCPFWGGVLLGLGWGCGKEALRSE